MKGRALIVKSLSAPAIVSSNNRVTLNNIEQNLEN
jgi:hypothetical protein